MIPAILSCVFVIYLYQSLNNDLQKPKGSNELAGVANDPFQSLVDRLDGLQKRLDALTEFDKKASGK